MQENKRQEISLLFYIFSNFQAYAILHWSIFTKKLKRKNLSFVKLSQDKPYRCSECGKYFARKDKLQDHNKVKRENVLLSCYKNTI